MLTRRVLNRTLLARQGLLDPFDQALPEVLEQVGGELATGGSGLCIHIRPAGGGPALVNWVPAGSTAQEGG